MSEKIIITQFIHAVILNIIETLYWLPGERDVIIFYALQQQQEIILIERNFLAGKQINLNNFFTFAPLLIHLGAL